MPAQAPVVAAPGAPAPTPAAAPTEPATPEPEQREQREPQPRPQADEAPLAQQQEAGAVRGSTPATGLDCSGFVAYVFKQIGVNLPHQSGAIRAMTTPVSPREGSTRSM